MALERYLDWRHGQTVTLPAADSAVSNIPVGIRITDPGIVANLNEQGEGRALVFTANDSVTKLPHHVMRADFPASTEGAWSWFSRPESVYANGITYWFPVDEFGGVYVYWYKHSDNTKGSFLLETLTLGTAGGKDDHNNGAGVVLASGKVLVFYSDHNGTVLKCRKQTTAGDPTAWDAAVSIEGTNNTAYCLPVQLRSTAGTDGGDLYIFYRDTTNNYERRYKKSTDAGATWSAAISIFWSADNAQRLSSIARPYMHVVASNDGTKIHFVVSDGQPNEVTDAVTGMYINSCYHCYFDSVTGNMHQSDGVVVAGGTFAAPPSGGFDTWNLTRVLDGYTDQLPYWNWDIQVDANDYPVFVAMKHVGDSTAPGLFATPVVARWNGDAWVVVELSTSTPGLSNLGLEGYSTPVADPTIEPYYHGGLVLDPRDPTGRLLLSWPNPDGGGKTWDIHVVTSLDGGNTWRATEKLNTTRGGERKCIRPIFPRGYIESKLMAVWMEGHYEDFQSTFTGAGSSWTANRYATGIQSFPRLNDGYVAYVKVNLLTTTQVIHMYWDEPLAPEQAQPDVAFANWLEYSRTIHVNRWNTGREVDLAGASAFTVIFVGRWSRAAYDAGQHTFMSNWGNGAVPAAFLLREQAAGGNNVSCTFNTTSGSFASAAWSSSPAVQTWNTLTARWNNGVSSGQLRPHLNATALTAITGSAALMPAGASENTLWLGYSPHTNGASFFYGEIGFAGVLPTDVPTDWVEEFSESNPFNPSWAYATFGAITFFLASESVQTPTMRGQPYRLFFEIKNETGGPVTGATGLDSEVSKDAGAFADCVSEAVEIGNGFYYLDLTAAETNCDTLLVAVKTSSVSANTTTIILHPRSPVDGSVHEHMLDQMVLAFLSGPAVRTQNSDGTKTVEFYNQEGSDLIYRVVGDQYGARTVGGSIIVGP